jgi:DNA-binding beta-propeller fold protein YncE
MKQALKVANTYGGMTFDHSGKAFYVTGGVDDDVHIYMTGPDRYWSKQAESPIILGHNNSGVGLSVQPQAAGIAISADGSKLVVTNYFNDSISVLSKSGKAWSVTSELDLRPGKGDRKPPVYPAENTRPGW